MPVTKPSRVLVQQSRMISPSKDYITMLFFWSHLICFLTSIVMLGNIHLHLPLYNTSLAIICTPINLVGFHAKLSFFGIGHIAQTSLYQHVDLSDMIKACFIVGDMTWGTQIANPCNIWQQMKCFPINIPVSIGFSNILHELNFLFYFFLFFITWC